MNEDIAKLRKLTPSVHVHGRPEFVRLPRAGTRCPYSNLSRAALNALILGANPPVKSFVLRKKWAVRGIRMIYLESLLEHLHKLMEQKDGSAGRKEVGDE